MYTPGLIRNNRFEFPHWLVLGIYLLYVYGVCLLREEY